MNTKLINEVAEKNDVYVSITYSTINNKYEVHFSTKQDCTCLKMDFFTNLIDAMQCIDNFNIKDYEVIETTTKTYKKRETQL